MSLCLAGSRAVWRFLIGPRVQRGGMLLAKEGRGAQQGWMKMSASRKQGYTFISIESRTFRHTTSWLNIQF